MVNVTTEEKKADLFFIPMFAYDSFKIAVLEWYEEYCEIQERLPKPILLSMELNDKGYVNEEEEILYFENPLFWIIGLALEYKYDSADFSKLDLSVGERCDFERDLATMLDKLQMTYIDVDNKKVKNHSVTEVW